MLFKTQALNTIAIQGGEEGAAEEEAAYQAISAKETTDLRALMQVSNPRVNVEANILQGGFFTGTPPKSSKYRKVNLG